MGNFRRWQGANRIADGDSYVLVDESGASGKISIVVDGTESVVIDDTGIITGGGSGLSNIDDFSTTGVEVTDSTDTMEMVFSSGDFKFINRNHGGQVNMEGEDSGGDLKSLIVCDPDGASEAYYAGVKKFETTALGVELGDGTFVGEVQFVASGVMYIVNQTDGKNIYLSIQDNAGVAHDVFAGVSGTAPSAILLYDNDHRIQTTSTGFKFEDGTNSGEFQIVAGGDIYLVNQTNGKSNYITAKTSGGTSRIGIRVLSGTEVSTELFYAGVKKLETTDSGVKIEGTTWQYEPQTATTSGTSVTLTSSIPSWATEIQILFNGVSTNTTDQPPIVQIGDSGGFETTGYLSFVISSGGADPIQEDDTDGFYTIVASSGVFGAADTLSGVMKLYRWDAAEHLWMVDGVFTESTLWSNVTGTKTLTADLDRIQLTTPGGTATFDAGEARVRYR